MKRKPQKTVFGERLRGLRCEHYLSMDKLCEEFNKIQSDIRLNKSTISRYENGTQEPMLSTVAALANFFKVSPTYLTGNVDDRTYTASNIHNSAVAQGNSEATLIVKNDSKQVLSDEKTELLRIFDILSIKTELL